MLVTLVSMTPDPENVIANAGRTCYGGLSTTNPGNFIRHRIADGHESIIEHAVATFKISGISRACSHQLVRHRLASYSQESQRYVDMSESGWAVPDAIRNNEDAYVAYSAYIMAAFAAYQTLRGLGIKKEDARYVLPNAITTTIVVTMNFRELRHFFEVRCHKAAQAEIRNLAIEMLKIVHGYAPSVFGDLFERFVG